LDETRDCRDGECEGCDEAEEGPSIESTFASEGRVLIALAASWRETHFESEVEKQMKRSEIDCSWDGDSSLQVRDPAPLKQGGIFRISIGSTCRFGHFSRCRVRLRR
jgi:hypothetical protein